MTRADSDLVERAVAGDSNALTALLERHGPEIRERLRVGASWASLLDADDVMQVTYLEAFLRIDDLHVRTRSGFASWLERIAVNNLRDGIRELDRIKRPSPRRRVTLESGDSYRELLETLRIDSETPSRVARARECRQAVEAALDQLPRRYRRVICRHDLDGLRMTEVAAEMGCSRGAAHMLRVRALERLRELLGSGSRF